jgi:hypothetical protein
MASPLPPQASQQLSPGKVKLGPPLQLRVMGQGTEYSQPGGTLIPSPSPGHSVALICYSLWSWPVRIRPSQALRMPGTGMAAA